ncbi:hypothetical protein [Mucilaginibacter myungsuensis]|uniref:Uncharacterized protein n=1 Tax=Mucilaginibacter myungsuensis TaxID=649104 RepID=A0A929KYW0_9SPHI|nr:hypothetical protein [Mucilaginibacter myungsuensis]MBE9661125.1 hypothetical protein [Mucilaginibacter myungsuensis]MDN3597270.1 hypothetical protein [Mucilaginibacter myungsuensis]
MTKHVIALASALLLTIGVQAQSLTLTELISQLEKPFDQTEAFLRPKQFKKASTGDFGGIRTVMYSKQAGSVHESIGKSLKDSAKNIAPGINYMYNKWSFTENFLEQMKPLSLKLWRKYSDEEKTTWDYISPKYEVIICAYNDITKHTSMQVTWVDKRKLTTP